MNRFLFIILIPLLLLSCKIDKKNTPEGFEVHPDFNLQRVASEPLVFDPVEFKFDEQGRAFVLEMPGYPLRDADSRLVQLVDIDEDGIYDERQVYAPDLGIASSFMPYKNGFLVASPPHLLWIGDTDKNGEADTRKILMNGFSTGNLQHNFNGLTYGIDNWIYAANGGNSGKPFFVNAPENVLDLRGTDLKFHLEREVLARVGESSGGFKITFDDWGHLYETHNLEHVSHLVFEDRYIENLPTSPSHALTNISDHEENGLSRVYPIGEQETRVNHPEQSGYFSGACGITYYGGGIFPEGLNSSLLVADCVLNLVHLDVLSPMGASFKTSRDRDKAEFLASKERSFRPVNMTVGPDGALYVVDMHREVIEHPEWIPDELEVKMDLNAGKEKGRIYRITPKNRSASKISPLPLDDIEALVVLLGDSNQWKRITAHRLLVTEKQSEAIPFLKELFKTSTNPLARLHSLWVLEGLQALDESDLNAALEDTSPGVRENALKIAEKTLNGKLDLVNPILALTQYSHARVRMQATLALSTLQEENYNMKKDTIARVLSTQLGQPDRDQWVTLSIASALERQALDFVQNRLSMGSLSSKSREIRVLEILTELIGKTEKKERTADILFALQKDGIAPETQTKLIKALSRGWKKGNPDLINSRGNRRLVENLEALEEGSDFARIQATGEFRQILALPASSKIENLIEQASQSLFDKKIPVEERLKRLKLVGLDDFKSREALLYRLLDNKQPLQLQEEALSQFWRSNDMNIASRLIELWPTLGPQARKHATNILLYKSSHHDALLTAMENKKVGLGEFNLDLERRRTLLFSNDEGIRKRAEFLFSDAGVVQRKEAIEAMRPSLELQGKSEKGREVFQNVCAQCHRYGELGNDVGPVLTEINRKSKESLLYDILDPNAAVDTKYLNHQVQTKDGTIYTGIVTNETDSEIGLRMVGGTEKIIGKNDIDRFSSTGNSMMYEGLENSMDTQEMADLLAFLQQSE